MHYFIKNQQGRAAWAWRRRSWRSPPARAGGGEVLKARRISERTRAALAAYKARGGRLGAAREGAARLTAAHGAKGRAAAAEVLRRARDAAYSDLAPLVAELRGAGMSLRAIADRLNAEG